MKKIIMFIVVLCIFSLKYDNHTITYVAKSNYLAGNLSTSGNYRVDDQKSVIYNIEIGTNVGDVKTKFSNQATVSIYGAGGSNTVSDSEKVKTGLILRASFSDGSSKDYKLAVNGDVLGEGVLSMNGVQKVAKHILSGREITGDAFLHAADYDSSGEIHINDITKMMKKLNGGASEPGKTVTAKFVVSNSKVATASATSASCTISGGSSSCTITAPKLTPKSGYDVLGWNTNKNARTAEISNGGTKSISANTTYYAIGGPAITITFEKNRTFDNNSVSQGSAGYNYALTNIAADSLEYYKKTCINWDGTGCYIDDLPAIYSAGNEPHGFTSTYNDSTLYGFNLVLQTKFTSNKVYYARVYNDHIKNYFNLGESINVGGITFEFERGLDASAYSYYVKYINRLYNDLPMLFDMKGKVRILTETTYDKIQANYCGSDSAGCTLTLYLHHAIDVRHYPSYSFASLFALTHELGHAFDFAYSAFTRNYDSNTVSGKSDTLSLFNSYSQQAASSRPLSDYAYTNKGEFFAEAVAVYHGIKFNDPDYNTFVNAYQYAYRGSTSQINSLVEKYFCIARNKYNESANCP